MDNILEINEIEKELNEVEKKINLFFELIKKGVKSAKETEKNEVPLIFIDRKEKNITLYDIEKDQFYDVPMNNLSNLKLEYSNEEYILDIITLLKKYMDTTIKLLDKIDEKKGKT